MLEAGDAEKVRSFVASQRDSAFVQYRQDKNVEHPPASVDLDEFWEVLVGALLTSQQRSGPESYVSQFLRRKPFPLSYAFCKEQANVEVAAKRVLQEAEGIRFTNNISSYVMRNYTTLVNGLWSTTASVLESLVGQDSPDLERQAAEFVRKHFVGFGPKQSRNLLQGVGN